MPPGPPGGAGVEIMRKLSIILGLAVVASSAMAQSRSSFIDLTSTSGVTVTSLGGNKYTVNLSGAPTVRFGGQTYHVTDVFGFWALSDNDNLTGSTSNFGVWTADSNQSGTGGIVGWKTNPNTGIKPSGSQQFQFNTLDAASVERFGFHFRVAETLADCSNTFYGSVRNPAPEPASLAALGVGAVALIRRRKKK